MRTASQPQLFDEHGLTSLDGTWDFYPGDSELGELDAREPKAIWVPGLWEAQGYVELEDYSRFLGARVYNASAKTYIDAFRSRDETARGRSAS